MAHQNSEDAANEVAKRRNLTEDQIVTWVKLFYEHEKELSPEKKGRYPSQEDKVVWERDGTGQWTKVPGVTWGGINQALRDGARGLPGDSSLKALKKQHNLVEKKDLTEEQIVKWAKLFYRHAKEVSPKNKGRWPSTATNTDQTVWDKDKDGKWIEVEDVNWTSIDSALREGNRGLPGKSSLALLKEKYELYNKLTEAQILKWINLFFEHEMEVSPKKKGRWPNQADEIVWDKDEDGRWVNVPEESWGAIDGALRVGNRGLRRGSSLSALKKKWGATDYDILTEVQVIEWIKLFYRHEKEGPKKKGHLPRTRDPDVWAKNNLGQWTKVPNVSWKAINDSLRNGQRGLHVVKGAISLSQLIEKHNLKEWLRNEDAENEPPPPDGSGHPTSPPVGPKF